MAYRDYSTALGKIVDSSGKGDYTTISAAMADASSGDIIFVKGGTYTEDFTGVAGVSLVSFNSGIRQPNVNIVGKITFTAAGTFVVSGIRLTTNSDYFLQISGTSASIVNLNDCILECIDNTGISYTTSSSSADLTINRCLQEITATFALFEKSSPGTMTVNYTYSLTANQTTTANTVTAGDFTCNYCIFGSPFSISGTNFSFFMVGMTVNAVGITTSGTVTGQLLFVNIDTGTNAGVSIGAGTIVRMDPLCRINNSAANAITGAGTLIYSALNFPITASFNPTTITPEPIAIPRISSSSGADSIVVATNGEVTFPNTSAFLAYLGTQDSNATGDGTLFQLGSGNALTEIYDLNGDFNTNGTFTAPVTARYQFTVAIALSNIGAGHTAGIIQLVTSNNTYTHFQLSPAAVRDASNLLHWSFTQEVDMDASDTAVCNVLVSGSTKTVNVRNNSVAADKVTTFSGELIC